MKVSVKLFAVARQLAGAPEVTVELSAPATVGQLRTALATRYPELAGVLGGVLFAVNAEYAQDSTPLPPEAEVACIPPVSGG